MNTPAHLAASLFIWRREPGWPAAAAITLGAFLPDLPMFGFYVYQRFVGSSEQLIWSTLYFQPSWQLFFDLFNSIPIALIVMLAARKSRFVQLVATSALLHQLFDLPLHHDDAHRHFLPFSNWRFRSPVSYWDSNHFGHIVAVVELTAAVAISALISFRGTERPTRIVARWNLGLYLFVISLVLLFLMYSRFWSGSAA